MGVSATFLHDGDNHLPDYDDNNNHDQHYSDNSGNEVVDLLLQQRKSIIGSACDHCQLVDVLVLGMVMLD